MMSTAILMAMDAEQSGKQPVVHDVTNIDGPTFAQTLDARVGITSAILGKDSTVAVVPETPNGKAESTTKNLLDASNMAGGSKVKVFVGQLTPAQVESEDIHVAGTARSHLTSGAAPEIRKIDEAAAQGAGPVENAQENQADTSVVSQVATTVRLQTEGVEGNGIQLPTVQTPLNQREALVVSKTQRVATEQKTAAKMQVGDATQLGVTAKNSTAAVPPMADVSKTAHGVGVLAGVQAPNPIPTHTVATPTLPVAITASNVPAVPFAASHAALTVGDGKSGVGSGVASLSGSTLSVMAPTPADGSDRSQNAVHGVKTTVSDHEMTAAAPGDSSATTKPNAKGESSQQTVTNAGRDSDTKAQTIGQVAVPTLHVVASGGEGASGVAAPISAGLTKLTGGEGTTSTAGSSTVLKEQNGLGGVAGSMEPMPRTLSATPTALEVGIPDGTHGWLKVRAEMTDGGAVNASMSAASPASQEMLHRELPSLTAYLESEKVAVNTVVVHSTANAGAESKSSSVGQESGGSGQTQEQSNKGGSQQSSVKTAAQVAEDGASFPGLHEVEDGMSSLTSYGSGGSWLSVRA